MLANFERRDYNQNIKVWAGRYRNLQNMPHWHLEYELVLVERGSALVSLNNQLYELTPGTSLFISGETIHYIKGSEGSVLSVVLLDSSLLQPILKKRRLATPLINADRYFLNVRMEEIRQELKRQADFYEWKTSGLVTSLLVDIFRNEATVPAEPLKEDTMLSGYKHLIEEIEQNYAEITFAEAAELAGLSESYFSRYFHRLAGMTFSRYLNTVRVEKAMELLREPAPLPITDIAMQCGFGTIRHFNRIFKEITGTNPKRLPSDFVLNANPVRRTDVTFNPTLTSSELLP